MKHVLLAIEIDSQFVELLRVARLLKKSGGYKPILWFNYPYDAIERDLAICHAEGWEYITPSPIIISPPEKSQKVRHFFAKTLTLIRSIIESIPFFGHLIKYTLQALQVRHLLVKIRPHLLVMAEDSIGRGLYILIKLGNASGIPTVIVPFTIANASEPAEAYFDKTAHIVSADPINRFVGLHFPPWVYCHKGRKLLRLPAWNIIALELLGFAPRQPWVYNSEETSTVAVENEFMFRYYRTEGLPADRLVITGALYDDVLAEGLKNAETYRAALNKELDLTPNQPLLVCALPPNQFPRNCEFPDYHELIRFWMQTLTTIEGWNVIIRPHPRLGKEEVNFLKQLGVKITHWDTAALVPLCDLYVASVSATIRWAIVCGKPVINYDVYQMGYTDFINVRGVITINDKESFSIALDRLTQNREYYTQIMAWQRETMSQWGLLDGKSGERMLRLFNDVIQKSKERR